MKIQIEIKALFFRIKQSIAVKVVKNAGNVEAAMPLRSDWRGVMIFHPISNFIL
jgi:hypothetical protein